MNTKLKLFMLLMITLAIGVIASCDNGAGTTPSPEPGKDNSPKNQLPVCNAGADQTVTTDYVILNGSGYAIDGYIVSYKWIKYGGNEGCIIHDADSPSTAVTGLKPGAYIFLLTVTDNDGGKRSDYLNVKVKPKEPLPPTCDAGLDQTITLPTNSVLLEGTADDSDGTIIACKWTALLGPGVDEGTVEITDDASLSTTVNGLQKGTYVFVLTVKDNDNNRYSDSVTVFVKEG